MSAFRSLLIAVDFSEASHEAFRAGCSLGYGVEGRIVVLNVLEPRYEPEPGSFFGDQSARYLRVRRDPCEHEATREQLRETYAPVRPLGVEYQTREGDPAEEILRASNEIDCDLIVLGTHGRKGLRRLLAGSVAEEVLRKARQPVLVMRSQGTARGDQPVRTILHPTDFSEASEASLRVARLLAREHGARLVLLHVTPTQVVVDGMMAMGINPQAELDSLQMIRSRIDGPDLKEPVEIRLENGSAAFQILLVAEKIKADLIVMGTHGRSGIGRLIMGSEAETVLRRANCPVLAVKGFTPALTPVEPTATDAQPEPVATVKTTTLHA